MATDIIARGMAGAAKKGGAVTKEKVVGALGYTPTYVDDESNGSSESTYSSEKIIEKISEVESWTGTKAEWEALDKSTLVDGQQINITDDAEPIEIQQIAAQVAEDRQAIAQDKTAAETAAASAEQSKTAAVAAAESIPADYTELSNDVSQLKEDLGDLGNVKDSIFGTVKETEIDALTLISENKTENGYTTPGRINNGIYVADHNNTLYCFFLNNGGKFRAENLSSDSYGNPTRCWCAFSGVNGTTDELLAEYSDQVQTSGRVGVSTGGYITFPHNVKMVVFAHTNSDKSTITIKKLEDRRDGGIKTSVDNALNDIEQLKVNVKSNTSVFSRRLLNENTYKTGIAETAVASTASSITDGVIVSALKNDVANAEISEIFRYSVPMKIAGDTFPKYKAVTSGLPINLGYKIEFYFSGKEFEVMIHGNSALTVCVDEYSITSNCMQMPSDGNVYYQKVTFPSEIEHKHISIYIDGIFRGIKTNGVIEKYNANRLKIIADGDSITESTSIIGSGEAVINSWISKLAKVFNYDLFDVAFGGTGYLNNGTGRINMVDRFEDNVAKYNPDILISMGGLNDSYSDLNALETAINAYWNKVSKLGCKAICVTPFNPQSTIMQMSDAFLPILQKICAKYGIPLIDTARGITYDSDGNIITDNTNGYIKGIINSNNHDAFIGSDKTHLTLKGHEYFAKRMESEMYKLIRIDKYFN